MGEKFARPGREAAEECIVEFLGGISELGGGGAEAFFLFLVGAAGGRAGDGGFLALAPSLEPRGAGTGASIVNTLGKRGLGPAVVKAIIILLTAKNLFFHQCFGV